MGHGFEAHVSLNGERRSAPVSARTAWLLVAVSLAACEVPAESDQPVATATHALLRVKRSAVVGKEHEAIGEAFAGVVRLAETADPEPLLAGSGLVLPKAGQCVVSSRDAALASSVGQAEFLEAGDVLLKASDAETLLAPRVFENAQPAELSGVVYTSRDRASEPLPGGAGYVLKTTGSEELPALELRVQAPELLNDVVVGGAALTEVSQVGLGSEVTVGWSAGDARDLVYVEVSSVALGTLGVCAFNDAEGRGVLPRGLFGASGSGGLSFHRLREVAADVGALDAAQVRFDFELRAEVSFL